MINKRQPSPSKNWLFSSTKHLIAPVFLICTYGMISSVANSEEITSVKQLDKSTSHLVTKAHRELSSASLELGKKRQQDLHQLKASIVKLEHSVSPARAATLIHNELDLVSQELTHTTTPYFVERLLLSNDLETANNLFNLAEESGDSLLEEKTAIKFAEYYNTRQEWKKSIEVLNLNFDELSEIDVSQASMARGVALQNLKQHRESIKEYQKVSKLSAYYNTAQINIAVAQIRQGWWSEAHLVINHLLNSGTQLPLELRDRLYLMLGYSLLNNQYFRESREAFRNISLESLYTNRAIMGLVLTAFNQKDYHGALHTLSILNKKDNLELSVEESYLLLPHLYEKLEQFSAANAGYLNAINYYEARISQLNLITPANIDNHFKAISQSKLHVLRLANTRFDLTEVLPDFFQANLFDLTQLRTLTTSADTKREIESLLQKYRLVFDDAVQQLIEIRIDALNSYLSQSNYGLAQLYDNNNDE